MGTRIGSQLSIDTQTLIDKLRTVPVGGDIPYLDLNEAIGADVQNGAAHSLSSARWILLRDGLRFDTITDAGLHRMTDKEIALSAGRSIQKIRRTATREARKLEPVQDYGALTNDEKIALNTGRSMVGAVLHFAQRGAVRRLEAAVTKSHERIAAGETLALFADPAKPGGAT